MYMRLHTNLLYKVESIVEPSYCLLNFVFSAIGVFVGFHLSILNIFIMSVAYFCLQTKIPWADCSTSFPKKYFEWVQDQSSQTFFSWQHLILLTTYFLHKSYHQHRGKLWEFYLHGLILCRVLAHYCSCKIHCWSGKIQFDCTKLLELASSHTRLSSTYTRYPLVLWLQNHVANLHTLLLVECHSRRLTLHLTGKLVICFELW